MAQGREVTWGEVDGVPALWSDLPGPLHAHLLFGVGQAHETLPQHGLTHLLEHLVLTGSSQSPHTYNGVTGLVSTRFDVSGTPADVIRHLEVVCAALREPPVERLEHERGVLRTEAAQRAWSPAEQLLTWRWGPQGFGIPAYEELALHWAGAEDVHDWSGRFGADNAVLWLSQPPPPALRLPLAPVRRTAGAQPALVSPDAPLPGTFPLPERGVSFSLLCGREPAAAAAMWLLQHRLEQRLRHEQGLVYSVQSATEVLDGQTRHAMFRIDCLPEHSRQVQDEVVSVLLTSSDRATDDEWSLLRAQHDLYLEVPEDQRLGQYLDSAAQSHLLGRVVEGMAEWDEAVRSATREDVAHYLGQVRPSLVLGGAVPDAVPAALAAPLPLFSAERVQGTALTPSARHPDQGVQSAIVGASGVSLVRRTGDTVSVRTDRLAAVLCFDDGTRHLIGTDGFAVRLAPEEWSRPAAALRSLDTALPASLRVPMGPREPSPRVHPRLVPRDLWIVVRSGDATVWGWVLLMALGLVLGVVLAARGKPVPLALFLGSTAFAFSRERRKVPPLPPTGPTPPGR